MPEILADGLLLLVTIVWGSTFVIVKNAISQMGPLTFLAVRFAIAGVTLLGFHIARSGRRWREVSPHFFGGAIWTGLALFFSYVTQTLGLITVSAGKAAFITGLYVVIVPVASRVISGRAPDRPALFGVAAATVGLGLMSLQFPFMFASGDILVLLCAVGFAAHILLIGHYSSQGDPVFYSAIQLLVVAVASLIAAMVWESPLQVASESWGAIVFTGLFATAFAFLAQSAVQRYTSPTRTALVFSAEPVFGAIFAYILARETLASREIAGAALILMGMIVAELRGLWRGAARRDHAADT